MKTVTPTDVWNALFGGDRTNANDGARERKPSEPEVDLEAIFRQLARARKADPAKVEPALEELRETLTTFSAWLDLGGQIESSLADAVTFVELAANPDLPDVEDRLARLRTKLERELAEAGGCGCNAGSRNRGPRRRR